MGNVLYKPDHKPKKITLIGLDSLNMLPLNRGEQIGKNNNLCNRKKIMKGKKRERLSARRDMRIGVIDNVEIRMTLQGGPGGQGLQLV